MPFKRNNAAFIVIPAGAGPGQARIVITSVLPAPLSTYTFTDRAGYANSYAGGIIFYNNDNTSPLDDTYTYLAVVANNLGVFSALHMGEVQNGSVREVSANVPAVQIWSTEPSSVGTQKWISAGFSVLEAYAATGEAVLRGLNGATVRITNNGAAGPVIIASTGTGATLTMTVTDVLNITAGSVNINTTTFLNLNPGTELQLQGTRAYLLTQQQTNLCTAALSPIPNAYTDITGCSITLPTITTNAKYYVDVSANLGMNPAGLTIVHVRLLVDGVAQTQKITEHMHEVQRGNGAQCWTGTLATAGNHTFKIQAIDDLNSGVCDVAANDTTITVEIWESGG